MLAGAVRTYLNRYARCAGPSAPRCSPTTRMAGARSRRSRRARHRVAAVVDRARRVPRRRRRCAADRRAAVRGRRGQRSAAVRPVCAPSSWTVRPAACTPIEADLLAVSGGWNPPVHLAYHPAAGRYGTSASPPSCPATRRRAWAWPAPPPARFGLAECLRRRQPGRHATAAAAARLRRHRAESPRRRRRRHAGDARSGTCAGKARPLSICSTM